MAKLAASEAATFNAHQVCVCVCACVRACVCVCVSMCVRQRYSMHVCGFER